MFYHFIEIIGSYMYVHCHAIEVTLYYNSFMNNAQYFERGMGGEEEIRIRAYYLVVTYSIGSD